MSKEKADKSVPKSEISKNKETYQRGNNEQKYNQNYHSSSSNAPNTAILFWLI